jgi:hypothetical protein
MTRLSVAQLKQLVSRPDVVEMHDVTAQDPRLLVCLKATRNTVPVPFINKDVVCLPFLVMPLSSPLFL